MTSKTYALPSAEALPGALKTSHLRVGATASAAPSSPPKPSSPIAQARTFSGAAEAVTLPSPSASGTVSSARVTCAPGTRSSPGKSRNETFCSWPLPPATARLPAATPSAIVPTFGGVPAGVPVSCGPTTEK